MNIFLKCVYESYTLRVRSYVIRGCRFKHVKGDNINLTKTIDNSNLKSYQPQLLEWKQIENF